MAHDTDDFDSLIRGVAAAPPRSPPQQQAYALVVADCPPDALARMRSSAAQFDIAISAQAEGIVVASVTDSDNATRAASCALAWLGDVPCARIAIAAAEPAAVAINRANELAQRADVGTIHLDDAAAAGLDARFEIETRAGGRRLLSVRTGAAAARADLLERPEIGASHSRRFDLSFVHSELEQAYLQSRLPRWSSFAGANVIFVIGWFMQAAWACIVVPDERALVWRVAACQVSITAIAVLGAWLVPAKLRRKAMSAIALSGVGVGGVVIIVYQLFAGDLLARYIRCFFGLYLLVIHAASYGRFVHKQVLTWTLVVVWLVAVACVPHTGWSQIVDGIYWILIGQIIGTFIMYKTERRSRQLFLQRRIIEQERARSERLERDAHDREIRALSEELRRQVAERAGKLADALARLRSNATHSLAPGAIVEERYRIVRAIGRGGMGVVHEVERISDGRRLALKTLTRVADAEALARFAREAQIAAALDHPNVIAVLDVDVSRSGMLFLVMELVVGVSLAGARGRYGDESWALPILRQIAAALAAMHARGILHRDLKPANVLLDGARAKVADFGLAGLTDVAPLASTQDVAAANSPALTKTGALMGTPMYMAPELANLTSRAGTACDVFSFGVVAFELLTKELPFPTAPVAARLSGRAAPPAKRLADLRADLSPALCALVDRCLTEDAASRPAAEALASALDQLDR